MPPLHCQRLSNPALSSADVMAFPEPKQPDADYPPKAVAKISFAAGGYSDEKEREIPVETLVDYIIAALRTMKNKEGSTMTSIRRLLCSEGFLTPATDIRPAVILALKQGKIERPPSAVKAGVYGRYVAVEDKPRINKPAKRGV